MLKVIYGRLIAWVVRSQLRLQQLDRSGRFLFSDGAILRIARWNNAAGIIQLNSTHRALAADPLRGLVKTSTGDGSIVAQTGTFLLWYDMLNPFMLLCDIFHCKLAPPAGLSGKTFQRVDCSSIHAGGSAHRANAVRALSCRAGIGLVYIPRPL